ncbi:MAG: NADH-quinone oxidoreductase subunit NuoE [Candidatus Eremiobacterota bacterium]
MVEAIKSPSRKFEILCKILDSYSRDPVRLIPILQAVQEEYRYLPEEVMTYIATSLDIPPSRVYGVATFYSHFALEPKGKYVIKLCDGTACHVKKSTSILEALYKKLGVDEKHRTTPDMLFTVETVSCLGACGLAPVVVVNDDVHGQMTPEKTISIIDEIIKNS